MAFLSSTLHSIPRTMATFLPCLLASSTLTSCSPFGVPLTLSPVVCEPALPLYRAYVELRRMPRQAIDREKEIAVAIAAFAAWTQKAAVCVHRTAVINGRAQ